jgi:hypothetical protein
MNRGTPNIQRPTPKAGARRSALGGQYFTVPGVSTNLTTWATLTNFVGSNSVITFRDPAATNSSHRYYRATIP